MGYNTEKGGGVCMFKTLLNDRYTIERKYHDPDKPFNPYIRMAYHGYDYDESTGLDDSGIHEGLEKLSAELRKLRIRFVKPDFLNMYSTIRELI